MPHVKRLRRKLHDWFTAQQRPLPWRLHPHPYHIWLSEMMLQQTQISTMLPYFHRFIAALPDIASLAAASEEQVLQLWSGLGYYRRARQLHAAAQYLIQHKLPLPQTAVALQQLPGIGPYSAAAIASIAFGEAVACVDGNVIRVISRLFAIFGNSQHQAIRRKITQIASSLLDDATPGLHNQAMMELGALICQPQPKCSICPLSSQCQAKQRHITQLLPERATKPTIEVKNGFCWLIMNAHGQYLMTQQSPKPLAQAKQWNFPIVFAESLATAQNHCEQQFGIKLKDLNSGNSLRHHITRYRLQLIQVDARLASSRSLAPIERSAWLDYRQIRQLPISGLTLKIMNSRQLLSEIAMC